MSIVKTSLPNYVEEKRFDLIRNAVVGARTVEEINLQTGIKGATALNLLDTDVKFGDGAACGWSEAGTSSLSQRILTPGQIKVNMSFCDKSLLSTYANYQVRIAAGQKTLPFEEDFVAGVVDDVKAKLEKAIWQGDSSTTNANTETNKFDGFIKIAEAATLGGTATYAANAAIVDKVNSVYALIPTACYSKGDVVLFMGADNYRKYIQALIANGNLVITNVVNDVAMPASVLIPGTNVRVIPVAGLDGTDKMFASYRDNFVYGTDLAGDNEKFDLWYSQDNREFRLAIEFNAGVQFAYPSMVVEGKENA